MATRSRDSERPLLPMLLAVLLALASPGVAPVVASAAPEPDAAGTVFVLLRNSRLVAVRIADREIVAKLRLARTPSRETRRAITDRVLALSPDGRTLYVLLTGWGEAEGEPAATDDRIVAVDVATVAVTATVPIEDSKGVYHGLAVGPRSGTLYLFGNRAGAAVVARVDPATGKRLAGWTAREEDGHDWWVYQGAVSADERSLFLSYHGENTTGIDRFALDGGSLRRCPAPIDRPDRPCIGAHGAFALDDGGLVVATGDSSLFVMVRTDGAVRGAVDSGLKNNHLTEFALDEAAGRLYAVGPCGYTGGFSAVDLAGAGTFEVDAPHLTWTKPPSPPLVLVGKGDGLCGERLVIGGDGTVVVSRTNNIGLFGVHSERDLLFVEATTGKVIGDVNTPALPLDLLIASATTVSASPSRSA
jgi:hypothetical protein